MLGWPGRGLQAGEASLARWRPLQAALPARRALDSADQAGRVGRSRPDRIPPPTPGGERVTWGPLFTLVNPLTNQSAAGN